MMKTRNTNIIKLLQLVLAFIALPLGATAQPDMIVEHYTREEGLPSNTVYSALKDSEGIMGNRTKAKIVKNKLAPPFKTAEFDILYGKGISKAGEIVDIAMELGLVQKSGSWFSYNGERLAQGKDNARKAIASNPELMKELEEKIKSKGDEIDLGAGEAYSLEEDDEGEGDDFDIHLIDIDGED